MYIMISEDNNAMQFNDEPTMLDIEMVEHHGYALMRVNHGVVEEYVGSGQWEILRSATISDNGDGQGGYHDCESRGPE